MATEVFGKGFKGWKMILVAAQAWAERTSNTRYWTAGELQQMLAASHFDAFAVNPGSPIVIVAERSAVRLSEGKGRKQGCNFSR